MGRDNYRVAQTQRYRKEERKGREKKEVTQQEQKGGREANTYKATDARARYTQNTSAQEKTTVSLNDYVSLFDVPGS